MQSLPRLFALLVLLALIVTACGADADGLHIERLPAGTPVGTPTAAHAVRRLVVPPPPAPATTPAASTRPRAGTQTPDQGAARRGGRAAPAASTAPSSPVPVTASSGLTTENPALTDAIRAALGADAEDTSVVVRRLTDGRGASWNGDRVYYAASLYKLEVLYEALRQRDAGTLDFATTLPVTGRYLAEDLGTFAHVPRAADGGVEIAEAVGAMVRLSDNTSATMLLDALGHGAIDRTMRALGLLESSVNTTELPTTAADMARLMAAIAMGDGLSAASRTDAVALLLAQETRAGIPRAIPEGVPVGNKTGTWQGATHDVAVVYAPSGAYVIAVLSGRGWDWEPVTRVSAAVYRFLEGGAAAVRR